MKNLFLKSILLLFMLNFSTFTFSQTIREVYEECINQNVLAPVIVVSQSIQECGWHYESKNARVRKNLFGLTKKDGNYYEFNDWRESVVAYRDDVQYKLRRDEGYYDFLNRIGYASDPNYEWSVRKIVKKVIKILEL